MIRAIFIGFALITASEAAVLFDFNSPGSLTQTGWVDAPNGAGTNGTVSVLTTAFGAATLDTRDRTSTIHDISSVPDGAMWNDFVFANHAPSQPPANTGLQIAIMGLVPNTVFPITIWGFDDGSNPGPAGGVANRSADWSSDLETATLSFPDKPVPSSLNDYSITLQATSDASGTIQVSGIDSLTNPALWHNVFVNGLEVGDPVPEPGSLMLFGLAGLMLLRRRRL